MDIAKELQLDFCGIVNSDVPEIIENYLNHIVVCLDEVDEYKEYW